jgi:hypothetical protein
MPFPFQTQKCSQQQPLFVNRVAKGSTPVFCAKYSLKDMVNNAPIALLEKGVVFLNLRQTQAAA